MKNRNIRRGITWCGLGLILISTLAIIGLYITPLSYLYCLARENSWLRATDQRDLERRLLAFYTKNPIEPTDSMWGRGHELTHGQKMIQYLIFGKEPLDVVYSDQGSIEAIYTSYE